MLHTVIDRVFSADLPDCADIEYLLSLEHDREITVLFDCADMVRKEFVGDEILLRGLVEFSNYCRNTCFYCGLNKNNKQLQRYRLTDDQIMSAVKEIADAKIKTVVLQSGEDDDLDAFWLKKLIEQIKTNFDIAVTLSVGERSYEDYKLWRQAGVDRYLLKIETTDRELYQSLHSQRSFENRLKCSRNLKKLDYQNGSGCLVGLKGQTIKSLAEDIIFFKKENFEMIGIGLFIPHASTPLKNEPLGNLKLALKVIAITRIVTKDANMPATTAIGSIGKNDNRILALKAGANVLMPNFTPLPYRKLYEIYPGKRCVFEQSDERIEYIESMAESINRTINYSRGDLIKHKTQNSVIAMSANYKNN
ncbi:MAG: [FeFe] hydrogenase H-cluster radical SAM maturase HydE [Sedimentisphaerales bacterium]|nr:[FeFe] hydrogenase H-cluster radical SAM maturase HydE [Sedimentisphaerales bacterium]